MTGDFDSLVFNRSLLNARIIRRIFFMKRFKFVILVTSFIFIFTAQGFSQYHHIKSRWTGQYLNTKNKKNFLQVGSINPTYSYAQWKLIRLSDGYYNIRNRRTGLYLHTEHKRGHVEVGRIANGWHSAQWKLIRLRDGYYNIRNRWTGLYLHIENKRGHGQIGKIKSGWHSAQWNIINSGGTSGRRESGGSGRLDAALADTGGNYFRTVSKSDFIRDNSGNKMVNYLNSVSKKSDQWKKIVDIADDALKNRDSWVAWYVLSNLTRVNIKKPSGFLEKVAVKAYQKRLSQLESRARNSSLKRKLKKIKNNF
jgi:hypothetical protein